MNHLWTLQDAVHPAQTEVSHLLKAVELKPNDRARRLAACEACIDLARAYLAVSQCLKDGGWPRGRVWATRYDRLHDKWVRRAVLILEQGRVERDQRACWTWARKQKAAREQRTADLLWLEQNPGQELAEVLG